MELLQLNGWLTMDFCGWNMIRKEARRLEDLISVLVMLGILMVINPLVMEYDVLVGGFKHEFYFS